MFNSNEETGTREKILYEAISLFAKNGYSNTSIRNIAKAVGIKASSIYNHFPSKEAIMDSVIDLYKKQNLSDFVNHRPKWNKDIPPNIDEFMQHLFFSYNDNEKEIAMSILRIICAEQFFNTDIQKAVFLHFNSSYIFLKEELDFLMEKNLINPCDSVMLASALYSTIISFTFLATSGAMKIHDDYPQTDMFSSLRYIIETSDIIKV